MSAPTPRDPAPAPSYEVRVTITLALPRYDEHESLNGEIEQVMEAIAKGGVGIFPDATHYHGGIIARVRTAKQIASDTRRAEKRAKENRYDR